MAYLLDISRNELDIITVTGAWDTLPPANPHLARNRRAQELRNQGAGRRHNASVIWRNPPLSRGGAWLASLALRFAFRAPGRQGAVVAGTIKGGGRTPSVSEFFITKLLSGRAKYFWN